MSASITRQWVRTDRTDRNGNAKLGLLACWAGGPLSIDASDGTQTEGTHRIPTLRLVAANANGRYPRVVPLGESLGISFAHSIVRGVLWLALSSVAQAEDGVW